MQERDVLAFGVTDPTGRDALVIAPHPDDETLGCGGALALHARAGDRTAVCFLTDGDAGENRDAYDDYAAVRRAEAEAACDILGVGERRFLGLPDRGVACDADLVARLCDILDACSPGVVYVPSPLEPHPDHKTAAHAVWQAASGRNVEIRFCEIGMPLRPNLLVDITPVLAVKEDALAAHASQGDIRDYGEMITGLNRYRALGAEDGVTHCEAFMACRPGGDADSAADVWAELVQAEGARWFRPDAPVAVIIASDGRADRLRETLRSVTRQWSRPAEVVVACAEDAADAAREAVRECADAVVSVVDTVAPTTLFPAALAATSSPSMLFVREGDILHPEHLARLVGDGATTATRSEWETWTRDPRGTLVERRRIGHAPSFADLRNANCRPVAPSTLLPRAILHDATATDADLDRAVEAACSSAPVRPVDAATCVRPVDAGETVGSRARILSNIRFLPGVAGRLLASPKGRVGRNAAAVTVNNVFFRASAMATALYLSGRFGGAVYGVYLTVAALSSILESAIEGGLGAAVTRRIPQLSPDRHSALASAALGVRLLLAGPGLLLVFLLYGFAFSGEGYFLLLVLAACGVLLRQATMTRVSCAHGEQRMESPALALMSGRGVGLLLGVVGMEAGFGLAAFFTGLVIGDACTWFAMRRIASVSVRAATRTEMAELVRDAWPLGVVGILTVAVTHGTILIVSAMLGDAAVGVYGLGFRMAEAAALPAAGLVAALLPVIAGRRHRGRLTSGTLLRWSAVTFCAASVGSLCAWALVPPLAVFLDKPTWIDAAGYIPVVAPGFVLLATAGPWFTAIVSGDRLARFIPVAVCVTIVSLVGSVLLIPSLGPTGAAVAFGAAAACHLAVSASAVFTWDKPSTNAPSAA